MYLYSNKVIERIIIREGVIVIERVIVIVLI